MKVNFGKLRRLAYGTLALAVLGTAIIPALSNSASAAQLDARSIQLNSSAPSATNVIYKVGFTVANAATNIGGIAIDFCANTPIIGDSSCTTPTGLDSNDATLTVANMTNISGLSVDATNSTATKVILTKTAGAPTAAAISFELGNGTTTGFTNPSTVSTTASQGTFYARIYTYAVSADAQSHSTTAPTGYTDAGGIALSTASQITVTAKVQETLTFCVYTAVDCATGGDDVNLGDNNGVLSTTTSYVDSSTKYDVASNAANGVSIRFRGDTLKSGTNEITALTTPGISVPGSNQFGLCSYQSSGTTLTIDPVYEDDGPGADACNASVVDGAGGDNGADFALDTDSGAGTMSTYGDVLATATAGTTSTGTIAFLGNVNPTQAAGIYTSTFNFIATGTY